MSVPFVHLHCHTEYSLLDGAGSIKALLKRAKEQEQPALAITDHGNLYGALDFYRTAKELEIKPILGYEAYIAPGNRKDKSGRTQKESSSHITLLAMNSTGFRNLIKLSSIAYLEGFHYKPRIDKEILQQYSEGIICLSGCASGELAKTIFNGEQEDIANAIEVACWYRNVFGDRYYIELQDHGLTIQKEILAGSVQIARDLGIPAVATNDVHYIYQKDADAQDILLCVNTGAKRNDVKRMRMDSDKFFLRSGEEMLKAIPGQEDAIQRSLEIADRCDCQLELGKRFFPVFTPPDNKDSNDYLRELCLAGLKRRYANNPKRYIDSELSGEVINRLDHELNIIKQLGFANYFLIVWDFVREAEVRGIHRTARGSGVGAIVCYALNMSHVCPLEYDLLFERFLDLSRKEAPDIDIDFDQDRRAEIIDYVKNKYGESNVAQLGTFGTMAAKQSIKDVGRAMDMTIPFVNDVTKLIPDKPGTSIDAALNGKKDKKTGEVESPPSEELKKRYENEPEITELIDYAQRIEGLARNTGVHACGVVIADQDLTAYVPLQTDKFGGIVTQWEGKDVEDAGLLKMDFLGLRNLAMLAHAIKIIKETTGELIDPYQFPVDDKETYEIFQRGETKGIFQFESGGMRELLQRMKPDNIRDIIATAAMYRPGPLEGGMVDTYVNVKHGREKPRYDHPILKEVLEETHGVMVYQEQIMKILNQLGNIPLGSAYTCIKYISKKKDFSKFRDDFVKGAKEHGLTEAKADDIFDLIVKFAGYGFNKSHSTAYAFLAYMTAYLKKHYPLQFMAALLCSDISKRNFASKDATVEHLEDCERMGITVIPPDVNLSHSYYSVTDGKIMFALAAINHCGEKAADKIVEARERGGKFVSLYDFCERTDNKLCNKSTVEALVKAGAFDSLGETRMQLFHQIEGAARAGQKAATSLAKGQKNMFAMLNEEEPDSVNSAKPQSSMKKPAGKEWEVKEKAAYEKEYLGFYLSGHPLKEHEEFFRQFRTHSCSEAALQQKEQSGIIVAGSISEIKISIYKNPRPGRPNQWVGFTLEDAGGSVRSIMWADQYVKYADLMKSEQIVFAVGRLDRAKCQSEEDAGNLIIDDFFTMEEAPEKLTRGLAVTLNEAKHSSDTVQKLYAALKEFPGTGTVEFSVQLQSGSKAVLRDAKIRTAKNPDVYRKVKALLGEDYVRWIKSLPKPEKPNYGYKKMRGNS